MRIGIALLIGLLIAAGAAWLLMQRSSPVTPKAASAPASMPGGCAVPIVVEQADGVGALQFELIFEPEEAAVEKVETGPLASHAMLEASTKTPGKVVVGLVDVEGIRGSGSVAVVRFKGTAPPAALALRAVQAYHADTRYELTPWVTTGSSGADGASASPVIHFGRR